MKKILILFCLSIAPLMSWAVTKIDAQTYTNPSQLPPAFTWVMERYDICDPGTNFKNENHTHGIQTMLTRLVVMVDFILRTFSLTIH